MTASISSCRCDLISQPGQYPRPSELQMMVNVSSAGALPRWHSSLDPSLLLPLYFIRTQPQCQSCTKHSHNTKIGLSALKVHRKSISDNFAIIYMKYISV